MILLVVISQYAAQASPEVAAVLKYTLRSVSVNNFVIPSSDPSNFSPPVIEVSFAC